MFRTKKNVNFNEPILKKKSKISNSNEPSTDEGSNQKTNLFQLKQKISPNIIILNNKTLSTHIPLISPNNKRNFDFKNDVLIKEIIGNDDLLQEKNNQFRSLFNLDNKNLDKDLNEDINNCYIPNSNSSLMSKDTLKKNLFDKKDNCLDEDIKGYITKKYKRKKSLNINKLKIFDYNDYYNNNFNTPKNHMKDRLKKVTLNSNDKKNLNNSDYNYAISSIYQNTSKSQLKYNKQYVKNEMISKFIFKNNSNLTKQDLKQLKEKKIEKIRQIMNSNNNPSLNVNLLRKGKNNNLLSILSNFSDRNKKVFTLQNNLNFNDLINTSYKKNKKKLIFRMNTYKKEKTDYYDNNDVDDKNINNIKDNQYKDKSLNNTNYISNLNNSKSNLKIKDWKFRSLTRGNFYRKSQNNFNDLNTSTEYNSCEKKNISKSINKKKIKHISLDNSNNIINIKREKNHIYENIKYDNDSKEKINSLNYKDILNEIPKRMNNLISKLVNYIEFLKKDKELN